MNTLGVQVTSLEAWECLQPTLGKLQRMVYNIIKVYPGLCNREISEIMGKPINCVTPRVKELRDHGLVFCSGYKIDPLTGKRVMTWKTI